MDYTLIRSRRKSTALQINDRAELVVRAPVDLPVSEIDRIVEKHAEWIRRNIEQQRALNAAHPEPDAEREALLRHKAKEYIPSRVQHYADIMGLHPASVTIGSAKTRWGSCSSRRALRFTWRLMDYPPEAIDYVVVHELAHIVHLDHSREFYALVESVLPDYRQRAALLKK